MFLGYIPIVACVAALVEAKPSASWADLAFWTGIVFILLARLVDILMLEGRTAEGEPANLGHWTRHAASLTVIASVAWFCLRRI